VLSEISRIVKDPRNADGEGIDTLDRADYRDCYRGHRDLQHLHGRRQLL